VCPHRVLRRQPAWRRDRAHNPGNAGQLHAGQATFGLPEQRALRSPSKRVASKLSPLRLDAEMPGARPGISGRSTASFCLLRGSVEAGVEVEAADAGHLAVGADPDAGSQDAAGRGWGAPLAQSVAWARRRLE